MTVRWVLIVAMLMAMIAAWPNVGAAQGQRVDQPLDLPAMTLTPADLEAIGLDGYGRFGNGEFRSLDDYVARRAEFLNKSKEEVRAAFEAAGWGGGYVANLGVPAEPGTPESPPSREAFSVVYEYADATGAATAYEFNQQYEGVTAGTVRVFSASRTFGDASYMTHTTVTDPTQGGPSDQVDLVLRLGNVWAATGLIVFGDATDLATPLAASPDVIAHVEAMAARLVERIERVLAGESPDLSNRTLRLGGDDAPIVFSSEGYRRFDGDDPPYYNGYRDDFPGEGGEFANVVAAYELNQGLQLPGDPYYSVRLLQFADADRAAAYAEDVRRRGRTAFGNPTQQVDDAKTIGDESVTLAYRGEPVPGQTITGFVAYVRVGATVFTLLLEAGNPPDLATIEALAESQAACLASDSCPSSIPVPPTIVATPAATPSS